MTNIDLEQPIWYTPSIDSSEQGQCIFPWGNDFDRARSPGTLIIPVNNDSDHANFPLL